MEGILKAFSDIIPKNYFDNWTQKTRQKPSLKDFSDGRIATQENLVLNIINNLHEKHFQIILGRRDTGKTWLCYSIGFELINNYQKNADRDIWIANASTEFSADRAWEEIKSKKVKNSERYIIIEDCHNNFDEVEQLLDLINLEREGNLRFIFTSRKTGKLLLKDVDDPLFDLGKKKDCILNLPPSKEHAIAIINKFLEIEKKIMSSEDINSIAEKLYKYDLYILRLYLKTWNLLEHQKIIDINDDHIFDSIWSDRGEVKLGNRLRRDILLPLSSLCQFEPLVMCSPFLFNFKVDDTTFCNLRDEGIIELSTWRGKDCISLPENEAILFLRTAKNKESLDNLEYTKSILKKYLMFKPPNWAIVFIALYLSRRIEDRENFIKNLLISLVQEDEVWQVVKDSLKMSIAEISLNKILTVMRSLKLVGEIIKAKEFWFYYINNRGENLVIQELSSWEISGITGFLSVMLEIDQKIVQSLIEKISSYFIELKCRLLRASANTQSKFYNIIYKFNPSLNKKLLNDKELCDSLLNKLKLSTVSNLRRILSPLSKAVNLRNFLEIMSVKEWQNLIEQSNLNSIRLLFINFQKWNLPEVNKNLSKALANANLAEQIKNCNLFQINGLIKNLEEVDYSVAVNLIDRLAILDLSFLIFQSDAKVISWFLSKSISLNLSSTKIIIDKTVESNFINIICLAPPEEDFWLLWNIYRANSLKAEHIIKINLGNSLISKRNLDALSPSCLALLGLLQICNFEIDKVLLSEISNLKEIAQILNNEKSQTLLVLSLVALKIKLSLDQFKNLTRILSMQSIKDKVNTHPDLQLRSLLQKILIDSSI